jgi:hypothetical protein
MQVSLSIKKPIYLDYLKGIFEKKNGYYQLSRDHDLGKLIISLIQYKKHPTKHLLDHTTIVFILPEGRSLANATKHYLYISKESEAKVNEALDAIFNIDFDRFCIQGRKMQMMQKDIIQAFILKRKICTLIGDNETLKKREYRDQLSLMKKYAEQLYKKAHYRTLCIEKALNEYKQLIVI